MEQIVERVLEMSRRTKRAATEMSLDEIAATAGVSRSTLIRRIGDRATLDEALRARGAGGPGKVPAADRAIEAAARLYAERGVGQVSLEEVAAAAGCTVQAIYSQIGGRDALLVALAERYSPMPEVTRVIAAPPADLAIKAGVLYEAIMGSVFGDPPIVLALIAEVLSRPDGPLAAHLKSSYAPRAAALLRNWLTPFVQSGQIRPLPPTVLVSLFTGPMVMFNLTQITGGRPLTETERAEAATAFAAAFVRSVSV
jgi:AcrR family transcriptional regulator